jgi:uncharacterized membrane protein YcaP (DUF421 family)
VAVIPVVRAVAMWAFLLVLLRVSGKRTLADITAFDFIVLLVVSETTQQAMTGNDFSVTNAAILVSTLVLLQRVADWVTDRSQRADKLLNDRPVIIVEDGRPNEEWMRWNSLTLEEVLEEARRGQGIGSLEEIKYAVLERNGGISVIPRS